MLETLRAIISMILDIVAPRLCQAVGTLRLFRTFVLRTYLPRPPKWSWRWKWHYGGSINLLQNFFCRLSSKISRNFTDNIISATCTFCDRAGLRGCRNMLHFKQHPSLSSANPSKTSKVGQWLSVAGAVLNWSHPEQRTKHIFLKMHIFAKSLNRLNTHPIC